jgi:hypothetical protein
MEFIDACPFCAGGIIVVSSSSSSENPRENDGHFSD